MGQTSRETAEAPLTETGSPTVDTILQELERRKLLTSSPLTMDEIVKELMDRKLLHPAPTIEEITEAIDEKHYITASHLFLRKCGWPALLCLLLLFAMHQFRLPIRDVTNAAATANAVAANNATAVAAVSTIAARSADAMATANAASITVTGIVVFDDNQNQWCDPAEKATFFTGVRVELIDSLGRSHSGWIRNYATDALALGQFRLSGVSPGPCTVYVGREEFPLKDRLVGGCTVESQPPVQDICIAVVPLTKPASAITPTPH